MTDITATKDFGTHSHVFLGQGHEKNERKTWAVIALCTAMMVLEIVGGSIFGSLALVADGLHMSTHAAAMLIAALAYTYARKHANDPSFAFGTGKIGDLAGFSSAIILAMIALLIGYEAVSRLFTPVEIRFAEAIPIAILGLLVNIASAWLLSGGHDHHHGQGHGHNQTHTHSHDGAPPHAHPHDRDHHAPQGHDQRPYRIAALGGTILAEIFEDGVPPRFRVRYEDGGAAAPLPSQDPPRLDTLRPDGTRQRFALADKGDFWESVEEIPEPHQFVAELHLSAPFGPVVHQIHFEEDHDHDDHHGHGDTHKDHNMRAAFIHVMADAAVSVLAILGLLAAKYMGWTFMDPVMGIVGMLVIANWSYGLIRDTGAILLDKTPDETLAAKIRSTLEGDGDRLTDLHLWRLGPGHLGGIVAIATESGRDVGYYRARLARFKALSHLTVEIRSIGSA